MTPHDIIKHGPGRYECRICEQTWLRKPAANKCPGVKVHPRNDYAPLMTKGQLGHNSYQTSANLLPSRVGCYILDGLNSYVLLYDPAQAIKKPGRSRPVLTHDLVRYTPRHYECRVCFKSWQNRPQTPCPGVRVYDRYDYAPLLNEKQLAKLGYATSLEALPPDAGCYYHQSASRYIYLYDPIQAIPKTLRRGVHNATTEILWPLCCVSLLENVSEMSGTTWPSRALMQLQNEIINIAALTTVFTRAEIVQMAGDVLEFKIPPTCLSRFYSSADVQWDKEIKLRTNILIAYRRYQYTGAKASDRTLSL